MPVIIERRELIAALGGAVAWPLAARAAAAGAAGGRIRQRPVARGLARARRRVPQGPRRSRLCRGAQTDGRVPLAGWPLRSAAVAHGRSGPPRCRRYRHSRQQPAALAAKAATTTIPIVFGVGDDPVKLGLVASLARPGGNATGINFFSADITAKRLGLLHDLVPKATRIAVLVNPGNPPVTEATQRDLPEAARALGLQVAVPQRQHQSRDRGGFRHHRARPGRCPLGHRPTGSSPAGASNLHSAARYGLPEAYNRTREVEAGGLMSYGTDLLDVYRQVGIYTGQILKGEKPADLPVLQSTKFEFVINLQTARALGIEVPELDPIARRRGDRVQLALFAALRESRLLALSGGSQGGEFTSAFGGVAEVHGRTASPDFEAFDP